MENNDIGVTLHQHFACMFEGLIVTIQDPEEAPRKKWFQRDSHITDDKDIAAIVRRWRPNDLPLKSLYHLVNQLRIGMEVYTYYHEDFVDPIERWLARKGINVNVYSYDDVYHLGEDFKYNRDVRVLYTASEHDAQILGIRTTVVSPEGTFGF